MKILTLFLCLLSSLHAAGEPAPFQAKNYAHLQGMEGFSDTLLQIHFKLYQGYVEQTNQLISLLKDYSYEGQKPDAQYGALKRRFGWEYDGMRLHEYYFENLGGKGALNPKSDLYQKIVQDFGSYEIWKKDFIATGMMRGIGWSVLYYDEKASRLFNVWINEHDLGHLAGGIPLLVMDVFEHAYMPQYGLKKDEYITAFFKNINWQVVTKRFPSARFFEENRQETEE
jgi:Fe-Mn family superoxide dismutase